VAVNPEKALVVVVAQVWVIMCLCLTYPQAVAVAMPLVQAHPQAAVSLTAVAPVALAPAAVSLVAVAQQKVFQALVALVAVALQVLMVLYFCLIQHLHPPHLAALWFTVAQLQKDLYLLLVVTHPHHLLHWIK